MTEEQLQEHCYPRPHPDHPGRAMVHNMPEKKNTDRESVCAPLFFRWGSLGVPVEQGCPTLFLEIYSPVGFHSNPNKAHLIQRLEQGCPTLFLEIYRPVGFHSNPNKAHLIQQLEQGCPTLFLEIYRPVGFHSNPHKAHLIQQLAV